MGAEGTRTRHYEPEVEPLRLAPTFNPWLMRGYENERCRHWRLNRKARRAARKG